MVQEVTMVIFEQVSCSDEEGAEYLWSSFPSYENNKNWN